MLAITFVAAFYEASGASACHSGFHFPVETSAPPFWEENPIRRSAVAGKLFLAPKAACHGETFMEGHSLPDTIAGAEG